MLNACSNSCAESTVRHYLNKQTNKPCFFLFLFIHTFIKILLKKYVTKRLVITSLVLTLPVTYHFNLTILNTSFEYSKTLFILSHFKTIEYKKKKPKTINNFHGGTKLKRSPIINIIWNLLNKKTWYESLTNNLTGNNSKLTNGKMMRKFFNTVSSIYLQRYHKYKANEIFQVFPYQTSKQYQSYFCQIG